MTCNACNRCERKIPAGRPHYALPNDLIVCAECVFHAPADVHDLAAPTCEKRHDIWRHPRSLVLRRSAP